MIPANHYPAFSLSISIISERINLAGHLKWTILTRIKKCLTLIGDQKCLLHWKVCYSLECLSAKVTSSDCCWGSWNHTSFTFGWFLAVNKNFFQVFHFSITCPPARKSDATDAGWPPFSVLWRARAFQPEENSFEKLVLPCLAWNVRLRISSILLGVFCICVVFLHTKGSSATFLVHHGQMEPRQHFFPSSAVNQLAHFSLGSQCDFLTHQQGLNMDSVLVIDAGD